MVRMAGRVRFIRTQKRRGALTQQSIHFEIYVWHW